MGVTGSPNIRFYCGVPLVTQDLVRLGTLCVIDRHPRSMRIEQMNVLRNFAEVVSRELLKSNTGKNVYEHIRSAQIVLPGISAGVARMQQCGFPGQDEVWRHV